MYNNLKSPVLDLQYVINIIITVIVIFCYYQYNDKNLKRTHARLTNTI